MSHAESMSKLVSLKRKTEHKFLNMIATSAMMNVTLIGLIRDRFDIRRGPTVNCLTMTIRRLQYIPRVSRSTWSSPATLRSVMSRLSFPVVRASNSLSLLASSSARYPRTCVPCCENLPKFAQGGTPENAHGSQNTIDTYFILTICINRRFVTRHLEETL